MKKIEIIPLGTVSPYQTKNRNCPAFLVKYHNHKLLMDCGNGSTRLLNIPKDLENLNIIITHYHNDHFGDIGTIQYASYVYHNLGLLNEPLNLYLPKNEFNYNKKAIEANKESYMQYTDINDDSYFYIDDLKVSFHDNKSHTITSYMIKLENDSFKIIYTSDIGTTNYSDLVNYCLDSDLIICESSFLRKHNSNSNTHFTAFEAGKLAADSCSKMLVITHLWPLENRDLYLNEAKQNFDNSIVASESKKLILKK